MKFKLLLPILMFFAIPHLYALDLNREKLTDEILSLIYEEELDLMRNEIFARKGYVFSNKDYQDYFESHSWYIPSKDNSAIILSDVEAYNVELLKQHAKEIALAKNKIKEYLNKIKNKEIVLDNFCDAGMLNQLKIDHINFLGYNGEYSVSYDNGHALQSYSISIKIDKGYFLITITDYLSNKFPEDMRQEKGIDKTDAGQEYLEGAKPTLEHLFHFDSDWEFTYEGYK